MRGQLKSNNAFYNLADYVLMQPEGEGAAAAIEAALERVLTVIDGLFAKSPSIACRAWSLQLIRAVVVAEQATPTIRDSAAWAAFAEYGQADGQPLAEAKAEIAAVLAAFQTEYGGKQGDKTSTTLGMQLAIDELTTYQPC